MQDIRNRGDHFSNNLQLPQNRSPSPASNANHQQDDRLQEQLRVLRDGPQERSSTGQTTETKTDTAHDQQGAERPSSANQTDNPTSPSSEASVTTPDQGSSPNSRHTAHAPAPHDGGSGH